MQPATPKEMYEIEYEHRQQSVKDIYDKRNSGPDHHYQHFAEADIFPSTTELGNG